MQYIDRDIHQAKALIIDANPTSRSVLAAQLRDLGVQQVRQMSRVQDARLALEETAYLLRNPANARRLLSAVTQLAQGKGKVRELAK